MSTVGALGSRRRADVDAHGTVAPRDTGWELAWWIGADDRWRVPTRETAVRQSLVLGMPVVQTAMRVPGGDAVQRVYGVSGPGDPVVVEVENDSPAPFVVAFVVRGARAVALDEGMAWIDGRPALVAARAPSRWATARVGGTEVMVCSGQARSGRFEPIRDRAARAEAALLHPVPHRTTLKVALLAGRDDPAIDPRGLPTGADAAAGWRAQLGRGLRVDLPDEKLEGQIDTARAQVLLAGTSASPRAEEVAALEDWGFDAEVAAAWRRLSARERRRAARRSPQPGSWAEVEAASAEGGPSLLLALRAVLAHEHEDQLTILSELPSGWRGAPIDVRDVPTRAGPLSYSVRWHDERAALLWEGPPGTKLRAPGLDPRWAANAERGEALLDVDGHAA